MSTFRATGIWPINRRRVLDDSTRQNPNPTPSQHTWRLPPPTRQHEHISEIECLALRSSESVETRILICQLASAAHTSAAKARVSAELLRQEKEKQPASKTDSRIITKAKVIGIKELHRLRKKRLLDEAKAQDKRRKQLGTELKNSSTKRRAAIIQELKSLGGEVTGVVESEIVAVEETNGTLNPEQDPIEQTFHCQALAQISPNQAGDPGPATLAFRSRCLR